MTEINFRASSIGKLMTDADSIDEKFRTDEVKKIIAKTKRTDEEKAWKFHNLKAKAANDRAAYDALAAAVKDKKETLK